MDVADVGGAWILEMPNAEMCAVDVPPLEPVAETTIPWVYIVGAGIIGAIVGYAMKGRK